MAVESIDYDKCTDCGICMKICPTDVYARMGKTYYIARQADCMTCYLCEMDCPENCIFVGPWRSREIVLPY